jgi:hypothetical protein
VITDPKDILSDNVLSPLAESTVNQLKLKEESKSDNMRDFEIIDPTKLKVVQNLAISLEDSDEDESSHTLKQSSTEDKLLSAFLLRFEEEVANEISKISEKYDAQIKSYEKKGINPLTKKLIEKAKTEQSQAIEKKKQELETIKLRETDKIKAGVVQSSDQWNFDPML